MRKRNPFPFQRTRTLLLRVLNWLFPPESPTDARQEERQRLSQPLPNATGRPLAVADVWVAKPPTVSDLSPAPPQRAPVLSVRQIAMMRQMRLEQCRLQTTITAQSIEIARLAQHAQTGQLPTLHTLPRVPQDVLAHIDAQSRETPGEQAIVIEDVQDEGEPTQAVAALSATEQLAYWSKRRMA